MTISTEVVKSSHADYIPIPEEAAKQLLEKFGKRVICTLDGQSKIHCAIQRRKPIGYFIMVGKSTKAKLKVETGEQIELTISADSSYYKAAVPEELQAVFDSDPEGFALFEKLTDGKKRGLIHHIGVAKRSDTRINRALKIVENLKMGFTKPIDLIRS